MSRLQKLKDHLSIFFRGLEEKEPSVGYIKVYNSMPIDYIYQESSIPSSIPSPSSIESKIFKLPKNMYIYRSDKAGGDIIFM